MYAMRMHKFVVDSESRFPFSLWLLEVGFILNARFVIIE